MWTSCAGAVRLNRSRSGPPSWETPGCSREFGDGARTSSGSVPDSAEEGAVGDVDDRAVDDRGRVEREPADRLGHFVGPAFALGVDALHQLLAPLGLRAIEECGVDRDARATVSMDGVSYEVPS